MEIMFFKGTHPGLAGIYSRGVRLITKSQYSHVEIQFSDGQSASSSYLDGGVRYKAVDYSVASDWDSIELPDALFESGARAWFDAHAGQGYDLMGNLHFVVSVIGDEKTRWFCSEAVGAALGLPNSWRFDPGTLYQAVSWLANTSQREAILNLPVTDWAAA